MSKNTAPEFLKGRLEAFSEQGSEGTHWSFHEDGKRGYDGLRPLEPGDVLKVFNDAARRELLWQGVVDLDYNQNRQPIPMAPHMVVQRIDNVGTVHGIQKGIAPEAWADMFLGEKPALLIPRNPDKFKP